MFKSVENLDLNQISLTGLRALVFIGLLMTRSCTLEEIKKILISLNIMEESRSNDTLRIDLNTIKAMGCKISRSSKKTSYKYILTKHPFTIKITEDEIKALKKVYKSLKKELNISEVLEYDNLFKKIAYYICDDESKEDLLGITALKYYDSDMIKDLIGDCKYQRILELTYRKQSGEKETIKQILAKELVYKNEKFYIYGFDLNIKKPTVLSVKRIGTILKRRKQNDNIEIDKIKIKFLLNNICLEKLERNEEIVEETEKGYIIEGFYHNDFLAMQRILSFGSNCTVLEPLWFKQKLVNKIKEMRKTYER